MVASIGLTNQRYREFLLRSGEPAIRNSVVKRGQSQEHQRSDKPASPSALFSPPGLSSRAVLGPITCTLAYFFWHFSLLLTDGVIAKGIAT
jgi:hypothetical protein